MTLTPDAPARPMTDADLLLLGGIVVTMDGHHTIHAAGALAIRDGQILAVGPRQDIARRYRAPRTIDASEGLLLPGLIDGHTHLSMTLFRGLADDLPLHTCLEQYVWPAEHQFLTPETIRWGARLGAAELLRSGVTTCCDMYFYEGTVAEAVQEAGLRAILSHGLVEVGRAGAELDREIAYAERFVERWRGHGRIIPASGSSRRLARMRPTRCPPPSTAGCTPSPSALACRWSRTSRRRKRRGGTSAPGMDGRRSATSPSSACSLPA